MNLKVVSFYTNDFYENMSKKLIDSCSKFNIECIVEKAEDRGSWVKNCAYKSYFIYDKLISLNSNILWLDSDATIVQYPELLYSIKEDFAIRAEPGNRTKTPAGRETIEIASNWPKELSYRWFNSGTIYFSNNEKSKELCHRWLQLCTKNETDWDQWTLQQAWCDIRPSTYWLSQEYCQIRKIHGEHGAIILHDLASVAQKVNRA